VEVKDKGLMSNNSELGYANGNGNGTCGSGSNNHNNTITITTPSGLTQNNVNNNNIIIQNNHNNCNMVPIISVTPHSPGAKYNSILEDSLSHLQSIRETVVQMKNSSAQNTNFGNIGIINPTVIEAQTTKKVKKKINFLFLSFFPDGIIKDFLFVSITTKSKRFECDLVGSTKRDDLYAERQSAKIVDSNRRSHRHEKLSQKQRELNEFG
jgi:hypothetical protein